MTTGNIVPQREKTPITVGERGLIFRTLEDMYRFAQYVAASGLAPKGMEKPEAVVVALQYGLELGLSPAQSLQNIAVINNRPTLWGDSMLALCMSSDAWDDSVFHEWFDGKRGADDYRAYCRVGRKGRKEPIIRSFSMAQAKAASLLSKPGPWQQYPDRMLQMRARSWALRDAFPDVLRGCISAEEAMDITSDDGADRSAGVAGLSARLGIAESEEADATQIMDVPVDAADHRETKSEIDEALEVAREIGGK